MQQNTEQGSPTAAATVCSEQVLLFPDLISKTVAVDFAAGQVSSDGGGVLLARLDRSFGYLKRFAASFTDHRDPERIEHEVLELLRQRVYGLALGYEDLNDHDDLARDPLLATLCGKSDPLGQHRTRTQDCGKALAGKSTLNRLELTPVGAQGGGRYKKIVADPEAIEAFFIQEYVRSLPNDSTLVTLDLDATDDPIHGEQEGRFFQGYYGNYCYLPLYIFAGHWPVLAWLRTSKRGASAGSIEKVAKIVAALRKRFPSIQVRLRADSGFCRDELLTWCESQGVQYVFGLARNKVLERILRGTLRSAKSLQRFNESPTERLFKDFRYRAKSWGRLRRRVVGKAEYTEQGPNPRFIITNIPADQVPAQKLYEAVYCARGNMENRIKEQQLDLYADRTSTHTLAANQLRLWFSTLAYLLMNQLRQVGLAGTDLAQASCGTIRTRLFKVGALIRVSVRRVVVSLSSAFPLQKLFHQVAARLQPAPSS